MICQASYVEFLQDLPDEEFDHELQRLLPDTLQDLVAVIESAARKLGQCFRSCVIDDVQVTRARFTESECVVLLAYSASARRAGFGPDGEERIFGSAVLAIDEAGDVTYKGATFNEERAFVAPDVGVGD